MTVPPVPTRPRSPRPVREAGATSPGKSLRKPSAPAFRPREPRRVDKPAAPASLGQAVDDAFANVEHKGAQPAGEGTLQQDAPAREEVERLFRQIAAEHARHLRDFAFELSVGETSKQWAELCSASVAALCRAAEQLRQGPLSRALTELGRALDDARRAPQSRIAGPMRQRLLDRYEALKHALPEAFSYEHERDRREPIIVDTLLQLTPGVHRLAIDKLYASGINSLSAFYAAKASDLAQATGLDPELCDAIVERFGDYEEERSRAAPDEARSEERSKLRALLRDLEQQQVEFRDAEDQENLPRRREARKRRRALVREIDLVLAQLGELDLVDELERVPVERKIQKIGGFLRNPTMQAATAPSP